MPEDTDAAEPQTVTDPERVRELAEEHGAAPAYDEVTSGGDLRIRTAPGDAGGEPITWEEFAARFDPSEQVVRYRPAGAERGPNLLEVVDREAVAGGGRSEEVTDEPADVEADQLATSDTGDDEPVAFDRTESEAASRDEVGEAATAPAHDTERAPTRAAEGFVLDEIHEEHAGLGASEPDEEYLVFRNVGEEPIDLSGWTVENEAGRSYSFPRETVIGPGERITLHSGRGTDTENDFYWNADEPIWDAKRKTITVETAAGERVLRERYES